MQKVLGEFGRIVTSRKMSKSCKPLLRRTASEQQNIQSSKHGVLRKQISHPQPTTLKTIKSPSLGGTQKSPNLRRTQEPPSFNGIQKSPNLIGTPKPPSLSGTQKSPNLIGTPKPPSLSGTQKSPNLSGTPKPPSLSGTQKSPNLSGTQKKQLHGKSISESPGKPLGTCKQEEDELAVFIIDGGDKVQDQIVDKNAHAKASRGRVRVPCGPECILLHGGGGESVSVIPVVIPVIPVEIIGLEKKVESLWNEKHQLLKELENVTEQKK